MLNYKRYRRVPVVNYPERQWPGKQIEKAPMWCSVDLRDGNQALIEPMVVEEKIEFFNMLVKLGFKEIEIGFPAASQIEYDFLRQLVERRLIPDDVREACSFVNLEFKELTNKYPFELSGGQMQRLMIARIFLLKPKILLADEPTSMIDACSRATILDMLLKLRDKYDRHVNLITQLQKHTMFRIPCILWNTASLWSMVRRRM